MPFEAQAGRGQRPGVLGASGGDDTHGPGVKGVPGPYRFFFYSFDCNEPKHVHVRRERMVCKFWLEPVSLAANHGFGARELNVIRAYVQEHLARILEAWDEHCG